VLENILLTSPGHIDYVRILRVIRVRTRWRANDSWLLNVDTRIRDIGEVTGITPRRAAIHRAPHEEVIVGLGGILGQSPVRSIAVPQQDAVAAPCERVIIFFAKS